MVNPPKITRNAKGAVKIGDPTLAARLAVLKTTTPSTAVAKPLYKLDPSLAPINSVAAAGLGTINTNLFTPISPTVKIPFKHETANAKSKL